MSSLQKKSGSRGGSTSNLKKHLEHCHSVDWAKACKTKSEGSKSTPDGKPNLLGAMDKFLQRKTCPSWRVWCFNKRNCQLDSFRLATDQLRQWRWFQAADAGCRARLHSPFEDPHHNAPAEEDRHAAHGMEGGHDYSTF